MSITEQKFLLKDRAGKELAVAIQDNPTDEARVVLDFFRIKKQNRAKNDLISALDRQEVPGIIQSMISNAPFEMVGDNKSRPEKVLIGMYCSGGSPYYHYLNQNSGQYESVKVSTGDYENLCTEF